MKKVLAILAVVVALAVALFVPLRCEMSDSEETIKPCTYPGETGCSITYDSLMKLCTDSLGRYRCIN